MSDLQGSWNAMLVSTGLDHVLYVNATFSTKNWYKCICSFLNSTRSSDCHFSLRIFLSQLRTRAAVNGNYSEGAAACQLYNLRKELLSLKKIVKQ
jgi:hypothetical protein